MTPLRLVLAYSLDLLAGDPEWFPQPVRCCGAMIKSGERWRRRLGRDPAVVKLAGAAQTGGVVATSRALGKSGHVAWQVMLACTTLATQCLLDEAGAVIR